MTYGKKVKIEYLLSEKGRKESLKQGGDGKELQSTYTDLTPEIVDLARVDKDGNAIITVGFVYSFDNRMDKIILDERVKKGTYGPQEDKDKRIVYFDQPQTVESLLKWEQDRVNKLQQKRAENEKLWKQYEEEGRKKQREFEEKRKKEQEMWEERQKQLEKEKERERAEKAEWIQNNGSDYLRRAFKLNYNCQRQYVLERAEKELPGFVVDFDDNARWNDRVCPSAEALEEVEQLIDNGWEATVVWLTDPPVDDDEVYKFNEDDFEQTEAIVISKYLGKYDLIKVL